MGIALQHTDGPWRVVLTNNGTFIAGNKPGYLAEVRPCHSIKANAANASLLAAAPELLEALADLLLSAEASEQPLGEWAAEPFAKARAAFRKATGEAA